MLLRIICHAVCVCNTKSEYIRFKHEMRFVDKIFCKSTQKFS